MSDLNNSPIITKLDIALLGATYDSRVVNFILHQIYSEPLQLNNLYSTHFAPRDRRRHRFETGDTHFRVAFE